MTYFVKLACTIVTIIGIAWLARADQHADQVPGTIQATELWFDPWPLPADESLPTVDKRPASAPAAVSRAGVFSADHPAAF